MVLPAPAESPQQVMRLPPGVYFWPTRDESVDLLDRWIRGQAMPLPDADKFVFQEDVYSVSPDVLRRKYPPGNSRAGAHSWWFLGVSRFQCPGGGRATRQVATGGSWQIQQSKENLHDAIGAKANFRYLTGPSKIKDKTPWLMEEYTSALDDGTGKAGVPALYRIYVSPRASHDQIRAIYGEDAVLPEGPKNKKPVRVTVPNDYFDRVARLLPPGSVRRPLLGPQQNALPPPPQSHLNTPHEQFLEIAPPLTLPASCEDPCAVDDDFQSQFFHAAPLPGDVDEFQGRYLMEAGTPLPLPSCAVDVDFDLDDLNMWDFSILPDDFTMQG